MSTPRDKFHPGWRMTSQQHATYFRLLTQVYAARGLTSPADRETMRKLIHQRAFGSTISAKLIDHLAGFDAFKAACLAELRPADLAAQLRQIEQPLIRLRHAIRALADAPYIAAISRDKFGTAAWETDLAEPQLVDLRNTLCARSAARRRRSNSAPDSAPDPPPDSAQKSPHPPAPENHPVLVDLRIFCARSAARRRRSNSAPDSAPDPPPDSAQKSPHPPAPENHPVTPF